MRIFPLLHVLSILLIINACTLHNFVSASHTDADTSLAAKAEDLQKTADIVAQTLGTTREKLFEDANKIARGIWQQAGTLEENQKLLYQKQMQEYDAAINNPASSPQLKEQALQQKLDGQSTYLKFTNTLASVKMQACNNLLNLGQEALSALTSEQKAQRERSNIATKQVARWHTIMKAVIHPRTPFFALGVSAAIFTGKKGSEIVADQLYAYWSTPELAQETSLLSPATQLYNFFWQIKSEPANISDVILEPKTQAIVHTIAMSVKHIARRHEHFQNVLLYGPTGTGKTMLAKRIARDSGLEYIYFAASDIDQFGLAQALQLINRLFAYAHNSSKKLMIIIDECEILFGSRNNTNMSEQTRKVLTKFLALMGTKNPDFMIVGLTNRIQDFDEASLSRFDERINIALPGENERRLLIAQYVHDYIITARAIHPVYPSIIARLFGKKPSKPRRVSVTENLLDIQKCQLRSDIIDDLTHQFTGFSGREIEAFANKLRQTTMASKEGILTQEILDAVVARSVESFKVASAHTAALAP
jgi:ATPase family AAA domain-containing protein 3A/B